MSSPNRMPPPSLRVSLGSARDWLKQSVTTKEGAICPCCDRFDKVYHFPIPVSVIRGLIKLYKIADADIHHHVWWAHFDPGRVVCKVASLGLLRRVLKDEDEDKHSSGWWTITDKGVGFVDGWIAIPEKIVLYHGRLIDSSEKRKTIMSGWKNFSYEELMNE